MKKYIIVGGNPVTSNYGTMFTGLDVVGIADTVKEAMVVFSEKHDQCAGLLMVIDAETGKAADMGYHKQ